MRTLSILRFLNPPWVVKRLYVVGGELYSQYRLTYREPSYSTDPEYYQLRISGTAGNKNNTVIKAFKKRQDAIEFGRHCDLQDVYCLTYDKIFGKWIDNPEAAVEIIDDIR